MSFQGNEKKIFEFLRTPMGLAMLFGVIGCVVIVIVALVSMLSNNSREPQVPSEVDPASGEVIYLFPPTDDQYNEPLFIGFGILMENGMTQGQFQLFKDTIQKYAKANNIVLERVSYLKNSYHLRASYVFDFSIILNVDGEELAVEVDSSKGWKDILGAVARIWKDGKEVFSYDVNENNVCDYIDGCYYVEDGA